MQFRMLACDYDNTLAMNGAISPIAEQALIEVKRIGLLTALVTGREFDDLLNVCPQIKLFDLVVAENGAVLYFPDSEKIEELTVARRPQFAQELSRRGIPFSTGRIIIGTVVPHEHAVLNVIHDLGLELEIIFNKESVMVLPTGINKATGLKAGLERIGLQASEVIAIGDAENDHAFLRACGYGVAVANALDSVKDDADIVTHSANGEGVAEFVREYLLGEDRDLKPRKGRRAIAS